MLQKKFETMSKDRAFTGKVTSQIFYLDNVSIDFGNTCALKSVQLSINRGEMLFITGASGAGKSTLLRLLAGEISKYSGKKYDPQMLGQRGCFIAQVFQDLKLIDRLSIYDNLAISYDSSIYKNRKEFEADLQNLARFLDISSKLDLKLKYANGGLKQKVAIIRALLSKPDVLLADEPTNSLDLENAQKVFELLNLYSVKKGLTVIWTSHSGELVKRFNGRIVHLDRGKLVYSGHACFI